MFGVPAAALLVPIAWWVVSRGLPNLGTGEAAMQEIRTQRDALGAMTAPELRAAMVFGVVAIFWIARVPVQHAAESAGIAMPWIMALSDMGIAIAGAIFQMAKSNG